MRIWKYEVPLDDYFTLFLPLGAKPLTVQVQHGKPQMWVLLDDNETVHVNRKFRVAGTGHVISEVVEALDHIGIFQLFNSGLIFHVFEVKGK